MLIQAPSLAIMYNNQAMMLHLKVHTGNPKAVLAVNQLSSPHLSPVRPLTPPKSLSFKPNPWKSPTENGCAERTTRPSWGASSSSRPNVTSWKRSSKSRRRRPFECNRDHTRCSSGTAARKCISNTKNSWNFRKRKKRGLRKSRNKILVSLSSKSGSNNL